MLEVKDDSKFWRELLIKYIAYVDMIEGTPFLLFNEVDWFTEEEWSALQKCDKQMVLRRSDGRL